MPRDRRNNYPPRSSNSNYRPNQGSSNQNRSGFQGRSNSNNSHSLNRNRNAPSDKECTELMAAGKCFRCREPGHLSRNCPQGSNVRVNGPRPPGISTFNIEPEGTEGIIDIGDTIEILDSLPFLAISLEDGYTSVRPTYDLDTYWYEYNPDIVAWSSIGDSYALVAESILNAFHPYPGDDIDMPRVLDRFIILKTSDKTYDIYDTSNSFKISIKLDLLHNHKFQVAEWYARHLAKAIGGTYRHTFDHAMGFALAQVAQCLLRDG
ncbi:hypothetical protein BDQ17DRAFT_1249368, partial [Cyathus striatus]